LNRRNFLFWGLGTAAALRLPAWALAPAMKITKIETIYWQKPDAAGFQPHWTWVRIHTDTGHSGLGETYPRGEVESAALHSAAVRALLPRVKALAGRGVDLAVVAVREEAANVSPRSAADPKLNARLEARARNLKTRIANSATTKDWQGAAFNRYMGEIVADVLPLVAGDLAQRALEVALRISAGMGQAWPPPERGA